MLNDSGSDDDGNTKNTNSQDASSQALPVSLASEASHEPHSTAVKDLEFDIMDSEAEEPEQPSSEDAAAEDANKSDIENQERTNTNIPQASTDTPEISEHTSENTNTETDINQPMQGFTVLENVQSVHNFHRENSVHTNTDIHNNNKSDMFRLEHSQKSILSAKPAMMSLPENDEPQNHKPENHKDHHKEDNKQRLTIAQKDNPKDKNDETKSKAAKHLPPISATSPQPADPTPEEKLSDQLSQHSLMMKELLPAEGTSEPKATFDSNTASSSINTGTAFTINESIIGNPLAKGPGDTHTSRKLTESTAVENMAENTNPSAGLTNLSYQQESTKEHNENTESRDNTEGSEVIHKSILDENHDENTEAFAAKSLPLQNFDKQEQTGSHTSLTNVDDEHEDTLLNNLDLPPPESKDDDMDTSSTKSKMHQESVDASDETGMKEWESNAAELSQDAYNPQMDGSAASNPATQRAEAIPSQSSSLNDLLKENGPKIAVALAAVMIPAILVFVVGMEELSNIATNLISDITGNNVSMDEDDYEDGYEDDTTAEKPDSDTDTDTAEAPTKDSSEDTASQDSSTAIFDDSSTTPYWNIRFPQKIKATDTQNALLSEEEREGLWTKDQLETKLASPTIWHHYEAVRHIRENRMWWHAALLKRVLKENRKLWLSLEAFATLLESNIGSSIDIKELKDLTKSHRSDLLKRWSKRFRSQPVKEGDEKLLSFLIRISPSEIRYEILRTFLSLKSTLAKTHLIVGMQDPNERIADACRRWVKATMSIKQQKELEEYIKL